MSLEALPKELLFLIADYLPLLSIEALAASFNKQLTPALLPHLQPLLARRKNAEKMMRRFGGRGVHFMEPDLDTMDGQRKFLGIPPTAELRLPRPAERAKRLEYLDLKGDLHWLQPLCDDDRSFGSVALSEEELRGLQGNAASVGVVLPAAFVKFFSSEHLMSCMPLGGGLRFQAKQLHKVPTSGDQGAGSYTLEIGAEEMGPSYFALYLEPGPHGGNCVLSSDPDPRGDNTQDGEFGDRPELIEEAAESNFPLASIFKGNHFLDGFSFEEWLIMEYFEMWLDRCDTFGDERDDPLREYVRAMYVR